MAHTVQKVQLITRLHQEELTQTRELITKRHLVLTTTNVLVVLVIPSDAQIERSVSQVPKEEFFVKLDTM
jgi:hypothetical protein